MTIELTSPITGGAQTGFTSPSFTVVNDTPVNGHSRQYAVTALGGTMPSAVHTHTATNPASLSIFRPPSFKALPAVNPDTGRLPSVPKNVWKINVRYGIIPLAGQAPEPTTWTVSMPIPAGSDTADPDGIRAMCSLLIGALNQLSQELGDGVNTGIL